MKKVFSIVNIIIIFIYIFTLKLIDFPIGLSKLIIFFLIIFNFLHFKNFFKKKYLLIYILFIMTILYSLFITLLKDTHDFFYFKTVLMIFLEGYIGSYFIVLLYKKKIRKNCFELISLISFLQAIIIILFYIFPEIRNYIFLNIFELQTNFDITSTWFNRGIGLSGGGATFSLVQSIGLLCTILNLKKYRNKIFFQFQLISIILCGRTGIVTFIISVIVLIIASILSKDSRKILKLLLKNLTIDIVVLFIIYLIFLKKNTTIQNLIFHSFEMFSNFINEGSFSTESTDELKTMLFLPNTATSFLFGDGRWNGKIGNYQDTDSGYIRTIFFGGICMFILYYGLIVTIVKKTYGKIKYKEKMIYICIIVSLFISEIKEPFFLNFIINKIIFIVFWYFESKNGGKILNETTS